VSEAGALTASEVAAIVRSLAVVGRVSTTYRSQRYLDFGLCAMLTVMASALGDGARNDELWLLPYEECICKREAVLASAKVH
jgi:hypothetical protein